jgi:hypothetical protein
MIEQEALRATAPAVKMAAWLNSDKSRNTFGHIYLGSPPKGVSSAIPRHTHMTALRVWTWQRYTRRARSQCIQRSMMSVSRVADGRAALVRGVRAWGQFGSAIASPATMARATGEGSDPSSANPSRTCTAG